MRRRRKLCISFLVLGGIILIGLRVKQHTKNDIFYNTKVEGDNSKSPTDGTFHKQGIYIFIDSFKPFYSIKISE